MDNPARLDFDEWLRRILERVFTAELERHGYPDLEFVFLPAAPVPLEIMWAEPAEPDTHEDWRALNE